MLFRELVADPVVWAFVGFRFVIDSVFHLPAVEIIIEDNGIVSGFVDRSVLGQSTGNECAALHLGVLVLDD